MPRYRILLSERVFYAIEAEYPDRAMALADAEGMAEHGDGYAEDASEIWEEDRKVVSIDEVDDQEDA